MLSAEKAAEQSGDIARLIEERLGIGGTGLRRKMNKAGRQLPKWVRRDAETLLEAELIAGHPKMMMKADPERYSRAYKRIRTWLKGIDPNKRRTDRILGMIGSISFNLLLFAGLLIASLVIVGFL